MYSINVNNSMIDILFTVINNEEFEVNERVSLRLAFEDQHPERVTIDPSSAVIIIEDKDGNKQ